MKKNIATLTLLAIALFFALTAGMLVANQLQNDVTVEGHEAIGPYFMPDGQRLAIGPYFMPDGQRLAIGPYFMPDGQRLAIGPYFLPDGQRLAIGPYFMPDGARSTARMA